MYLTELNIEQSFIDDVVVFFCIFDVTSAVVERDQVASQRLQGAFHKIFGKALHIF